MRDFKFLIKFIYLLVTKGGPVICDQDVRNPEAVNDVLVNESSYCLTRSSNQRDGFHPFSKVLCSSQDKLVLQQRSWGYSPGEV